MRKLASAAILTALFLTTHSFAAHLFSGQDQNENGTITGRVTLDGKPARGVIVIASGSGSSDPSKMIERMFNSSKSPKAETDSDGHYRIEGLPAGQYDVGPSAPTMVSLSGEGSQKVSIKGGATSEGIDFKLSRGGVITGKVTDSDGRPLIAEAILLTPTDASKQADSMVNVDQRMYRTDDRGIYRIFGVPPGKYLVSAGASRGDMFGFLGQKSKKVQTFFPGVAEETRAKPVEVIAGSETAIDIKLIASNKGFSVGGRVIDGETGKPISEAIVAYTAAPRARSGDDDEEGFSSSGGGMTTTNARGEFRFDSLASGNYKAIVQSMGIFTGTGGFFADPLEFEVQSSDVDKLEIKVHQGASISGVVVVENGDASEAFNQIVPVMLYAGAANNGSPPSVARVSADASFRLSGLKPGRLKITPVPYSVQRFSVLRIERDGVEQPDGIDVQANEQISGVRVVMTPANCVIRGHVTVQGDTQGASIWVSARPLKNELSSNGSTRIDAKGDFVIEYLAPGDYEVEAGVMRPGTGPERNVSTKQIVTVTNAAPAEVHLVLNLNQ
jgi:hypothetical protein